MSNIFFYFSGTGNSYAVSEMVAQKLGQATVDSIINIEKYPIEAYQKIGFVFPVYYNHAPQIVINTIKKIDLIASQRIFLIATYGSACGYAMEDLEKVLNNKAHNIQEFGIRMPGNYILEYGAFPDRLQRLMLRKSEKIMAEVAEKIENDTVTERIKPGWLAKAFKSTADQKVRTFGELGLQFWADENCIKCGKCVQICPANNIKMLENEPIWDKHCQQCMACVQWCPQDAVRHPKLKEGRKRYHHPQVSFNELCRINRDKVFEN
ncbi:EFR1 family ferrodoxin [Eubacteriaceae bacterium ES2]|nr:EFR1 family ferrodoxin [Eubacteriaceae bacterium ES2]